MQQQKGRRSFIDRGSALFVAFAAALWAADAYFRPALTQQLSASQIVFAEDLLISVALLPFLISRFRQAKNLSGRGWIALAVIAIGPQALATVLFTASFTYAFPPNGAPDLSVVNEIYLLYLLQPIFGIALAWLFLREKRKPYFWPLAAVAMGGIYLIVFAPNPMAPLSSWQHPRLQAAGLVVAAVALWAAGTVLGRYALGKVPFLVTTSFRFLFALPVLFVLMALDPGSAHHSYSTAQLPALLGIALIPGFIAMLLYYRALSSTPASMATLAELGFPCALFLVFTLPKPYGEGTPLFGMQIIGALMLVVAVTALNLMKQRDVIVEPRPHELGLALEAETA